MTGESKCFLRIVRENGDIKKQKLPPAIVIHSKQIHILPPSKVNIRSMKKWIHNTERILALITFVVASQFIFAQTSTILLQPNANQGKDAYVDSRLFAINYGNHPDFAAMAWTNGGTPTHVRSLVGFDLSVIPAGAIINSARLSLYSFNSPSNGAHANISGSNESVIQRITSSWEENAVTWENQPATTSQNQVFLPASTSSTQDYLDINVTQMVQDMMANPSAGYGFLLKLVTEEYYRSMIFASSDNTNTALHPKLEVTYTEGIQVDTCLTMQPDNIRGRDAYIDSRLYDNNYGSHIDFPAMAWTNGGTPTDVRGLIDFPFSDIPDGATILSASLSLYSYNSPANGAHSKLSGSNESVLSRITSPWSEETVTWENQPTITTQNQVFLPESTSAIQDYLNIDVTNMVQDMMANPTGSYGFLLKLVTEEFYRSMIFASSDNPNPNLHPKLEVCYSTFLSVTEEDSDDIEVHIFPNPSSGKFTIDIGKSNSDSVSITIINSIGQIHFVQSYNVFPTEIDLSYYAKGLYFVKISIGEFVATEKVVVQ